MPRPLAPPSPAHQTSLCRDVHVGRAGILFVSDNDSSSPQSLIRSLLIQRSCVASLETPSSRLTTAQRFLLSPSISPARFHENAAGTLRAVPILSVSVEVYFPET